MLNFVQIYAIANELWAINYYCQFWLHGPFPVMAGYTPAKLH